MQTINTALQYYITTNKKATPLDMMKIIRYLLYSINLLSVLVPDLKHVGKYFVTGY